MAKGLGNKICVIGDGIAAWCVIDALLKEKPHDREVIQIYDKELFPPCSINTTSINCLRGSKRGLSPLGDKIVDSFYEFESFYEKEKPEGIILGKEVQFFNDSSKWERRYPEFLKTTDSEIYKQICKSEFFHENAAYFIEPKALREWYHNKFKKEVIQIHGAVTSIDESFLEVNNEKINFTSVFVCTGAKSFKLLSGRNKEFDYYLDHCKPVSGTYFEIPFFNIAELNKFDHPINFAIDKYHFIYRKKQKVIQIGSTTDNKTSFEMPNETHALEIFNYISNNLKISVPDKTNWNYKTGVRVKGHKRMPYWGEVSKNCYAITGLYKNAFTFAYLAAKELVSDIA